MSSGPGKKYYKDWNGDVRRWSNKNNDKARIARFVLSTDNGIEAIDQTVRDLLGTVAGSEQWVWYIYLTRE